MILFPVSILYKSTAGRYRPVRVADGPIAARYRFIKNASWDVDSNVEIGSVSSSYDATNVRHKGTFVPSNGPCKG